MTALSTRDALVKSAAETILYHPATFGVPLEDRKRLAEVMADRIAAEAFASGAVVDVATLADVLCKRICDMAGDPRLFVPGEVRSMLTAALTERAS